MTLLLLAALLFGLGLIVWEYGFGGLWYFLVPPQWRKKPPKKEEGSPDG